jgi:hypothetical protein
VVEPIDIVAVQNGLVKWVRDSTGLTTVWGFQGPRPPYPYACLKVLSAIKALSNTWVEEQKDVVDPDPGAEIKYTNWVPCDLTVQLSVCGNNAELSLLQAEAALQTPALNEELGLLNVVFVEAGQSVDLFQIFGEEYRPEQSKDFTFGAMLSTSSYGSFIETVRIQSTGIGFDETITIAVEE